MKIIEQKYRLVETKLGMLAYIARRGKLIKLITPGSKLLQKATIRDMGLGEYDSDLLPELADKLAEYFEGSAVSFNDISCDLTSLSAFAQRVLSATREIPFGTVVSYKEIADMIGSPKAARAVGRALASNPIPIVIPCHRVIRSDGQIGGYSGSNDVRLKRKLLRLERCFA